MSVSMVDIPLALLLFLLLLIPFLSAPGSRQWASQGANDFVCRSLWREKNPKPFPASKCDFISIYLNLSRSIVKAALGGDLELGARQGFLELFRQFLTPEPSLVI